MTQCAEEARELPILIKIIEVLYRVFTATFMNSYSLKVFLFALSISVLFASINGKDLIESFDEKVTRRVNMVLKRKVFDRAEFVYVKQCRLRFNSLTVEEFVIGNARARESAAADDDDDDDDAKKKKTTTTKNRTQTEWKFQSPNLVEVKRIEFKGKFWTMVPLVQFENFVIGFLSANVCLIEVRGVTINIEEWRGRGNFRVVSSSSEKKKKMKMNRENTIVDDDDDLIKRQQKRAENLDKDDEKESVVVVEEEEEEEEEENYLTYFQNRVQKQIEDANKKIQDAANKTIEISGTVVKEIGSAANEVTDKLSALSRYAMMINKMQEDPIEAMKRRPLVLKIQNTKLIDWNVKILTVSETSFHLEKFENDLFIGTGKAFGKFIAQGVLQRIIVEFQNKSLNLITNGVTDSAQFLGTSVADGFTKGKKLLEDQFDGVKTFASDSVKKVSAFNAVDPHELRTPNGSARSALSSEHDSVEYELVPQINSHEMTPSVRKDYTVSATDLFGLGNLFSTCSTASGRKDIIKPPSPTVAQVKSFTGKPGSPEKKEQ